MPQVEKRREHDKREDSISEEEYESDVGRKKVNEFEIGKVGSKKVKSQVDEEGIVTEEKTT